MNSKSNTTETDVPLTGSAGASNSPVYPGDTRLSNPMPEQPTGSDMGSTSGSSPAGGVGSTSSVSTSSGSGLTSASDQHSSRGGAQIVGGQQDMSNTDGPGPQVMSASTFVGEDVVNRAGEDLGDIKEIMLDVRSGKIAYAVLECGGFLGMGQKLFAVPWSAITIDADNHRFILDCDRQRLENAPGFDADNWPSMADPQWASQVHSYYGARPYWE